MKSAPVNPVLLAAAAVFSLLAAPVIARTWTNSDGRKVEAELIEATATEATLKIEASGQNYRLPLAELSEADRLFVKQWLEKKTAGGDSATRKSGSFENWDEPWPNLISTDLDLEITTVEEDEDKGIYVYQSPHYEFICDAQLGNSTVKRFSVLFEATNDFCRALPLSMAKARTEKRHRILLFESYRGYMAAGGPRGSAGVYIPSRDIIMVPLASLGVKKVGGRYQIDYDETNETLPHEITHQITDPPYYFHGAMGWFSEGLAEYVAETPYRGGKFSVNATPGAIKKMANRRLGKEVRLPDLKTFLLMSYGSFVRNAHICYPVGAMMTSYFFHDDGDKDGARIKEFLKALKSGKRGEEALEFLLDGRSYEELAEEISKAWRGRGVKLVFESTG